MEKTKKNIDDKLFLKPQVAWEKLSNEETNYMKSR